MSVASLSGYAPKRRYDSRPWVAARIEGAASTDGPWAEVETFTFADPDADPSQPAIRNFTTELVDAVAMSFLRVVFLDGDGDQDATDPLSLSASGSFATVSTVATRLGRELSGTDAAQCNLFIAAASTGILAALDRNPLTWSPAPEARPMLSMMCVELVARTMANPTDLQRKSEAIGSYSYTEMYAARGSAVPGLIPTPTEELLLRRVVFGSNTASVKVRSFADDWADLVYPYLMWSLWWGSQDDTGSWIQWII
jgi:hypothetical protein